MFPQSGFVLQLLASGSTQELSHCPKPLCLLLALQVKASLGDVCDPGQVRWTGNGCPKAPEERLDSESVLCSRFPSCETASLYLILQNEEVQWIGCCSKANNDSPAIQHRQGLLILGAGEVAQKSCKILLHVTTAGHGNDKGTAGLSSLKQYLFYLFVCVCVIKRSRNKPKKETTNKETEIQWLELKSYQQTASLLKGAKHCR